jgi:O-acetylserine/cysteine efflux transporter
MSPTHLAAALLIVAMWGLNFTVIRFGLDEFTPFAFATWRFLLGALPAFFIPKPAVSWSVLAGIGGLMFGGQASISSRRDMVSAMSSSPFSIACWRASAA